MPRTRIRVLASLLGAAALAATLTACDAGSDDEGTVHVVASTDVYGDLAASVGGDLVTVVSIIDDAAKDPHEYQADARTQLAVSRADVVVRNGGGYDDFVDTLLDAVDNAPAVIDAVALSGYDTTAPDFNEHVWYDYPTIAKVVDALATELAAADPAHGDVFFDNAAELASGLTALEGRTAALATTWSGTGAAITEPVPLYLIESMGLVNRTPAAFSEAVEDDTDAPPAAVEEMLDLVATHAVAVLAVNPQTGGPQTDAVLAAAEQAGVPQVEASELLPTGFDYLGWQSRLIDEFAEALEQGA